MSRLANTLNRLAETWANVVGSKARIMIDENVIKVRFVNPSKDSARAWENTYKNAGLFLKGYTNALKPDKEALEDKAELMPSTKYKQFMEQKVIKEAFTSRRDEMSFLAKLMIAQIVVLVLLGLVIYQTGGGF